MTLIKEQKISTKALRNIAEKMMLASRTAPKGKGTDTIKLALAEKAAIEIVAMDNRVDNRILYTAGQAVLDLSLLGDEIKVVYCIPISATSKNIFFDR